MPEDAKRLKETALRNKKLMQPRGLHFVHEPLDRPFMIIVLILVVMGLIMMFSASFVDAYYYEGDGYLYIKKQAPLALVGLIAMYVASRLDYHIWKRFAWPLMGITYVLLVLVLFMSRTKGTKRWIYIGIFNFQPSEIAKFAVIVLFAYIISSNYKKMKTLTYGVFPFVLILASLAGLLLLEPHLSGTMLIFAIGFIMMLVGGTRLIWFGAALGFLIAGIAGAIIIKPDLVWYAQDRLRYWIDPWEDPRGLGHQVIQSIYAIGSGGLFGLGIGNSRQKHLYLPEPQNDFIFAVVCEELGFIGALMVIFLFIALMWRGAVIACKAKDRFGSMLVVGIITQVTVQAALNIAVVTKTIPNTGISLPFFSYGGTSLMMLLGEMGVVLSVSRQSSINTG